MAVKTFTSGEVLTASDTNTYLNNGGLVYITSLSFTTSATATISNCFNATYDLYRVQLITTAFSGNPNLYFQFTKTGTPTAANYYWSAGYTTAAGGSGASSANPGTAVNPAYCANATPQGIQTIEIMNPNTTTYKSFTMWDIHNDTGGMVNRTGGGIFYDATAHDGIRFTVSTGTMSGTLFVYGYRKA